MRLAFWKKKDKVKKKKTWWREWLDAGLFAIVAATIIRTFLVEAYTIPTGSMEGSLLVNDYLFVSKITFGPKIPNTPLAFPFVHHTMPLTETVKSYVEWISLPFYRFPGFRSVRHNDAVVFNYPAGDTVSTRFQSNASYYTLIKEYGRDRVWSDKRNFGEIVEQNTREEIFSNPQHEYTKTLLAATPRATVESIKKRLGVA